MKYVVIVISLLLVTFGVLKANGCKVVTQKQVVAQKQVQAVVVQKQVDYFTPSFLAIPYYSLSYDKPDLSNEIKQLRDEVKALTERLQPQPQPQPQPADPFNFSSKLNLVKSCSACHEEKVARDKGDGYSFIKGDKLKELSGEDYAKIIKNISNGRMPKKTKLAEKEKVDLISSLFEN